MLAHVSFTLAAEWTYSNRRGMLSANGICVAIVLDSSMVCAHRNVWRGSSSSLSKRLLSDIGGRFATTPRRGVAHDQWRWRRLGGQTRRQTFSALSVVARRGRGAGAYGADMGGVCTRASQTWLLSSGASNCRMMTPVVRGAVCTFSRYMDNARLAQGRHFARM